MSESSIEKIQPQNIDAEIAVLGAMILSRESIPKVMEILSREDFYKTAHQKIFDSILILFDKNLPVDLVTMNEELNKQNVLSEIGGSLYLANLVESISTVANVDYHAKIVKEKSILRSLIITATDIVNKTYENTQDVDSLLDQAEHAVFNIAQYKIRQTFVPINAIVKNAIEVIEDLYHRKQHITGVPTGFKDLDMATSGFQPGELIIVAGRPSMGKTSFCLSIAQNASIQYKIPTAIFSLEMSKEQLVQRLLCGEARIDAHKVRTGFLSESDWPKLTIAGGKLSSAPLFIDDSAINTVLGMKAKARRLKAEHNLGLIVIDYLQLINSDVRGENRQQEISSISRGLKAMAKELNVPVVALSQLSRAVETRGGEHRPQLSDLRESGSIEQDADVVTFIYRAEYYEELRNEENEGIAEIIIGKQRNGPITTLKLAFIKEYTRFENLAYT
ncbi:MAG: replicative DNA helicase [Candidatus Firestonebacteria bacterium]|nr:replicative DNA helicase [Candidatus Firestonebacteria bacterium]